MSRWIRRDVPSAVLFDLDGTLVDTAPDMIDALNHICVEEGADPVDFDRARPWASAGAVGLLRVAFPDAAIHLDPELQRRYLERYGQRLAANSCLFPELAELLDELDSRKIPWGVVTNKPGFLTMPLLEALGLAARAACTISGDSLPERKPHPRPILVALDHLSASAEQAVFVGDALRDIESGRSAGATTVAVRYGYIEPGQDPHQWGADYVVDTPADLYKLITGKG